MTSEFAVWTPAVPTIISGTMKHHNPDACQRLKGSSSSRGVLSLFAISIRGVQIFPRPLDQTRFFLIPSASIIVDHRKGSIETFPIASRIIVRVRRRELSGLSSVDIRDDRFTTSTSEARNLQANDHPPCDRRRDASLVLSLSRSARLLEESGRRIPRRGTSNANILGGKSSSDARGD
jgi:hypothetical protein